MDLRRISDEKLKRILAEHKKWVDYQGKNGVRADLSGTNLYEANLVDANLIGANLSEANLSGAILSGAILSDADLIGAILSDAGLRSANLSGAIFNDANLSGAILSRAILSGANLSGAILSGAKLNEAKLNEANLSTTDLRDADLSFTDLCYANLNYADLSKANITGANLYATKRDDWRINGINCEYIFFDLKNQKRIPQDKNFEKGEFEKLYKHLPTIKYYFKDGFTPVDMILINKIAQGIQKKHPEFELNFKSFDFSGIPHAVFTVINKEDKDEALKEITYKYKAQIKVIEAEKNLLNEKLDQFISEKTNSKDRYVTYKGDVSNLNIFGDSTGEVKVNHNFTKSDKKSRLSILLWGVVASLIAGVTTYYYDPTIKEFIKEIITLIP